MEGENRSRSGGEAYGTESGGRGAAADASDTHTHTESNRLTANKEEDKDENRSRTRRRRRVLIQPVQFEGAVRHYLSGQNPHKDVIIHEDVSQQ